MADKKMEIKATYVVIVVSTLIIFLIIGWMAYSRTRVSSSVVGENDTANTEDATSPEAQAQTGGSLVVEDQAAGESVVVRSMDMQSSGWIAIREVGTGRVLGAGWFPSGATSGAVPLLRATVAGEKYEAIVYVDDGDKDFDMKVDDLVEGIEVPFSAQ